MRFTCQLWKLFCERTPWSSRRPRELNESLITSDIFSDARITIFRDKSRESPCAFDSIFSQITRRFKLSTFCFWNIIGSRSRILLWARFRRASVAVRLSSRAISEWSIVPCWVIEKTTPVAAVTVWHRNGILSDWVTQCKHSLGNPRNAYRAREIFSTRAKRVAWIDEEVIVAHVK